MQLAQSENDYAEADAHQHNFQKREADLAASV